MEKGGGVGDLKRDNGGDAEETHLRSVAGSTIFTGNWNSP